MHFFFCRNDSLGQSLPQRSRVRKKNVSGICVILNLVFAVIFANFINRILKEKYDTQRCC